MREWIKNLSSLIFAIAILLGILFLPETDFSFIKKNLDYISKADSAAYSFGFYLRQKAFFAVTILIITAVLTIISHRMLRKKKSGS